MLTNRPEKGFYYHYKHTPESVNNYAYEVLGVSITTELASREERFVVVYRPLYEKKDFLEGADFCDRPLDMFMGTIIQDKTIVPRFEKIANPEIIQQLEKIKQRMYP
jgi:hypothetical protein